MYFVEPTSCIGYKTVMLYAALAMFHACFLRWCYERGRRKALRVVGQSVALYSVETQLTW
jgi:hypothetical protein